jgi:glyoxylase-like metal-dependent hydrolase (beta-lactamase superfamily II)
MKPMRIREILPGTFRFSGEQFYGEEVGVYLIELPDRVVLIDIPAFRPDAVAFIRSFYKPVEAIATHGPTIIQDTAHWQRELGIQVALHTLDQDDIWLRGTPDRLFSAARQGVGRLEVIHTPGHSDGSVCILDRDTGALFTGDTVAAKANGRVRDLVRDSSHDADSKQKMMSVIKLAQEKFKAILPFHYSPLIGEARDKLMQYLEQGGVAHEASLGEVTAKSP